MTEYGRIIVFSERTSIKILGDATRNLTAIPKGIMLNSRIFVADKQSRATIRIDNKSHVTRYLDLMASQCRYHTKRTVNVHVACR